MPVATAKYPAIAEIIERRIARGDYALNRLPSGRKLSAELGVSYVTARKAIAHLVENGRLERGESGRLRLRDEKSSKQSTRGLEVAMLTPAHDSPSYADWRRALTQSVQARGGVLRPVSYVHVDDPVLTETLDAFDGVFFVPPDDIPPILRDRLGRTAGKLVTLFHDLTDIGIPCIDGGPPVAIHTLMAHLVGLGHQRIDCVHFSATGQRSRQRIDAWRNATNELGVSGKLHDCPSPAFMAPELHAKQVFDRLLEQDEFNPTALFCTTVQPVLGIYRSAYEHGIKIGSDLSIASFGAADRAAVYTPSLTTLVTGNPIDGVEKGLDWIASAGRGWTRSLMIEPDELELQQGESTRPAPHCF